MQCRMDLNLVLLWFLRSIACHKQLFLSKFCNLIRNIASIYSILQVLYATNLKQIAPYTIGEFSIFIPNINFYTHSVSEYMWE
jgi:hypothetical protein